MLFVVDLDSLELISAATDKSPVVSVQGKRGDNTPFEVIFVRSGVAEELATSTVLTFGAKPSGKYDDAAVVLSSDFTLSGTGTAAKYLGSPSFNTAELNALFLIDGDETNDPAYIDLMAEFTWQVGSGAPSSTKTFTFRVHNDVVRDAELDPTPLPTPVGTTAPTNAVTGVSHVETLTIVAPSGCTSNGLLAVYLDCDALGASFGIDVSLNTTTHTTAALIAAEIMTQIGSTSPWGTSNFTASRSGAVITFTQNSQTGPDALANFHTDGGLGVTAVASSTLVSAGVAAVAATAAPPYLRTAAGFLYVQEAGIWKKTALSAL